MRNRRIRNEHGSTGGKIPSSVSIYFYKLKLATISISKNTVPFWASVYCLYMYFTQTVDQDWSHLTYVAFIITCVNALFGFPWFSDESYTDVKVLLDYAQEILPLPCICAEIWLKYNVLENSFLAYLHAALGFSAFTFLVLYECKRMDLTDLTILTSGVSLATVSCINANIPGFLAAVTCGTYYFAQKRTEECCLKNKFIFDYIMALFSVLALFAFEPKQYVPPFLEDFVNSLGGGGGE